MTATMPVKDKATITPEGELLIQWIEGVKLKKLSYIEDDRGSVLEVYHPGWGFHPDPMVYLYQVIIRPNKIKGWVLHKKQDDRIYCYQGVMRWALFDNRPESPTYKMINDITISERSPAILTVPKGVYHAVHNIGTHDLIFFNLPTKPYNHSDPDKYRLPLKNDLIPFDFYD
jgi:dTDP-4-dehydrorhamnose 3,5-epimerase